MIKIIIHTGNAAFEDGQKDLEVARILEEAAQKAECGNLDFKLYDINGNSVGRFAEMDRDAELVATGDEFVRLELDTGNAAFEDDDKFPEVARILRVAAEKVRDGDYRFKVRDLNGNSVGRIALSEDEPTVLYEEGDPDGIKVVRMPNGHVAITDDYATDYVRFEGGGRWVRESDQLPVSEGVRQFLSEYDVGKVAPTPGATAPSVPRKFGYYISLDERGSFYADVRDEKGKTVFEIKAGNELAEDETSIFDDGFMENKNDLAGLHEYLVDLGIITKQDKLLTSAEFERALSNDDTSFEP